MRENKNNSYIFYVNVMTDFWLALDNLGDNCTSTVSVKNNSIKHSPSWRRKAFSLGILPVFLQVERHTASHLLKDIVTPPLQSNLL